MIEEIWILEKNAGRCIFNRPFSKSMIDPDLITTVLNVLYHISIELSGKGIENIEMAGFRWYFVTEKNLIFIIMAHKNANLSTLKKKSNIIKNEFFSKFKELKKKNYFKKWNGNVSGFDAFHENIDALLSDWDKAEEVTDHATMMDLLEVYQHIFKLLQLKELAPSNAQSKKYLKKRISEILDKHPFLKEKVDFNENRIEIMERIDMQKDHLENLNVKDMLFDLCQGYVSALKRIHGTDKFYSLTRESMLSYCRKDWDRLSNLKLLKTMFDIFN